MTNPERTSPEKDPWSHQPQELLSDAFKWVVDIVKTKADPLHDTIGRASIVDTVSNTTAHITVNNLYHKYAIEYLEERADVAKNVAIEYNIFVGKKGQFILTTSGEHPHVVSMLQAQGADEQAIDAATEATRLLREDSERYASRAEIEELHMILELIKFGDEQFDMKAFEAEYEQRLTELEEMQKEADKLAQNNPD